MDHTIALIRKSHAGDKEAREQLVEENTGLVWCVVRRFRGRGTEAEDLFQIGSIGSGGRGLGLCGIIELGELTKLKLARTSYGTSVLLDGLRRKDLLVLGYKGRLSARHAGTGHGAAAYKLVQLPVRQAEETLLQKTGHVHPFELGKTVIEFGIDVVELCLHHGFLAICHIGQCLQAILKGDACFVILHLCSLVPVVGKLQIRKGKRDILLCHNPLVLVVEALFRHGMEGLGLDHTSGLHPPVSASPVNKGKVESQMQELVGGTGFGLGLTTGRIHVDRNSHIGHVLSPGKHDLVVGKLYLGTQKQAVLGLGPAFVPAQGMAVKALEDLARIARIHLELLVRIKTSQNLQIGALHELLCFRLFKAKLCFAFMLLGKTDCRALIAFHRLDLLPVFRKLPGHRDEGTLRLQDMLPGGYATTQVWTPMSGTLTLNRWSIDQIVYPETWTEMPVTEAMALKKPEYLIVNLGENGVSFMDEEYFKSEYTALVQALAEACPETKIMCASLFPVAASYPYQRDINNEKLAAASAWIYEIAEAEGLRYIDLAAAVKGEDGALPEHLHIGDGYHLNAEGHQLVLDYIRTHGYI